MRANWAKQQDERLPGWGADAAGERGLESR
jgi:hypothetical protein